uniref:Uncharacterized protein n=1 Tax=Rhizophora mucronata TaxID=61149 RepID=A0A2P2NEH6_RHIMU
MSCTCGPILFHLVVGDWVLYKRNRYSQKSLQSQ